MTALKGYQRLEALGVWREQPDAQRRNVVVSLGDSTIVIMDMKSRPLTHWAIPAVERANPGVLPALYHPDGDPSETLEIGGDEIMMIEAIEKLRAAINRARPKQGRLRWGLMGSMTAILIGLGTFWLPDALREHAVQVVPPVKRAEIGLDLINRVTRITGPECRDTLGSPALARLGGKLFPPEDRRKLMVMSGGPRKAFHLPGGTILLHRSLVENFEDGNVLAGFALVEGLRAGNHDPLAEVLAESSLLAVIQFLTTGSLPNASLDHYAEQILSQSPEIVETQDVLALFKEKGIPTTPYARELDPSGSVVGPLVAADPFADTLPPTLLSDGDWISIQGICQR